MYCPGCGARLEKRIDVCPQCGLALSPSLWSAVDLHGAPPPQGQSAPPQFLDQVFDDRYQIEGLVGSTETSDVYLATAKSLARAVAVKMLAKKLGGDPEIAEHFKREAKALGSLDHPNVVAVYSVGEVDGRPYFAMKHIAGTMLSETIRIARRLPAPRVIEILDQLCDGLEHIHLHGLVHRNIKPRNVMIEPQGRWTILDFGILRRVDTRINASGLLVGTPAYMAPELIQNPKLADPRADLYSLGITLFEMLTGAPPFQAASAAELLAKQMTEAAPRPSVIAPEVPPLLDAVTLRLLAKDPESRYQRVGDVKAALMPLRGRSLGVSPRVTASSAIPLKPPASSTPPDQQPIAPKSSLTTGSAQAPLASSLGARPATGSFQTTSRHGTFAKEDRPMGRSLVIGATIGTALAVAGGFLWAWVTRDDWGGKSHADTAPIAVEAPQSPSPVEVPTASPASAPAEPETATKERSTRGNLVVSSSPPDAKAVVDGKPRGVTPATVELEPGEHTIEVSKNDFQTRTERAQVAAGETERLHVTLDPVPATLEIVTVGARGTISIDGEVIGTSERVSSQLRPGTHVVRVVGNELSTVVRTVTLTAGEKRTLEIPLEKSYAPASQPHRRRR